MYHDFFIHSSVDGHLGCFHVLAIVNSAAMHSEIHVSFSILVSSEYMPRSKIAEWYGGFIPSFLRTLHTVFHAAAKSLQSYPTLCDPIDGSPLGSSVPGILQARILEWVAISSFNAWKWKVKKKSLSHVPLLATPWTAAYQAPLSMGILQARTLEWVAISSFNAWKWKVKVKSLSRVRLLSTPWTAAHQVSPSMGFSRQEYWSGMPLPSPTLSSSLALFLQYL